MKQQPNFRKNQPLKVGFDLDGVLLYNPARIVRPLISCLKKKEVCIHRQELEFYVPQTRWEEVIWELFHKSSIFLAPGFEQILQLKRAGKIEPYLITGRFGHLKKDFNKWKQKMKADQLFKRCFINDQDQQPHLFKQAKIKELGLDVFIEDNWDIVNYLANNCSPCQVFWISNFFDRKIDYQFKFMGLKQALAKVANNDLIE